MTWGPPAAEAARLLREADALRACTCGDPHHAAAVDWLVSRAAQLAAVTATAEPAVPVASVCGHGCCPPAVCEYVNDCAFHAGGAA